MRTLSLAIPTLTLWTAPASAEWTLDNDSSQISFVSTKAGTAAEVHGFDLQRG